MTTQLHDERPDERRRHADEDLPEGSVVDGELLTRSIDDAFDVVIVGSGAAGATAAVFAPGTMSLVPSLSFPDGSRLLAFASSATGTWLRWAMLSRVSPRLTT